MENSREIEVDDTSAVGAGNGAARRGSWRGFPTLTLFGLVVAWYGFHWDIATHIDVGRDGFATAPHITIILGALLALVSAVGRTCRLRAVGLARTGDITAMFGGAMVFAALALDNSWHTVFGTDVTVWSPPHLLLMTAFMLILLGVLRTAVEGAFSPVVVCCVAAFSFLIPALALVEFQAGTPPFSVVFEPFAWAALFGFAIGVATVSTLGWRFAGATTGAAMWGIQALAGIGNAALGRPSPIPQLGVIVAGAVFDLTRTRPRAKWPDGRATDVIGASLGSIALIAAVGVERSLVGHTWWSGPVQAIGLVAAAPLAALGYLVGAAMISKSFFGFMRSRRLFGVALAVFVFISVAGYPILTRSPTRHIDVTTTLAKRRLTVRTSHSGAFDQLTAFRLVQRDDGSGSRLVWIDTLEKDGSTFRISAPALDTNTVVLWYAHGIRHFYGTVQAGGSEVSLSENLSLSDQPSLIGVFSGGSFLVLFSLTYLSMLVLFRPGLIRVFGDVVAEPAP